jgi:predicted  nucleic acid-binding Zn-ribbon protein
MKSMVALPDENVPHHRLLGGWRDVLDDIRALCRTLEELPGVCMCGHGPAHTATGCPCCGHTASEYVPACAECDEQIARLRPALDEMTVDTFRFFPVVKEVLARHDPEASRRLRAIDTEITALQRSFQQLVFAEGQFRKNCRAEHVAVLKQAADELRRGAETLNRLV